MQQAGRCGNVPARFTSEDTHMSKRKQDTAEAVEAVEAAAPVEVVAVEAEAEQPPVEQLEDEQPTEQPPVEQPTEQAEAGYLVVWHVKVNGTLHPPGSRIVELDDETAARFLASGAIV